MTHMCERAAASEQGMAGGACPQPQLMTTDPPITVWEPFGAATASRPQQAPGHRHAQPAPRCRGNSLRARSTRYRAAGQLAQRPGLARVRRHCALTQQAVRSHFATGSGTLGRRPRDGLLGRLVGVVKDCGTPLLPGPAPAGDGAGHWRGRCQAARRLAAGAAEDHGRGGRGSVPEPRTGRLAVGAARSCRGTAD